MIPLTFHWYDGNDPPFTGVAVNVTKVLGGTGFDEAAMVTLTGCTGLTDRRTFPVAVVPRKSVTVTL